MINTILLKISELITFFRFVGLEPFLGACTASTKRRLLALHHEDKGRGLLIRSHEISHIFRKLCIILPVLEAILEEVRWIIFIAIQDMPVEALLAKDLAIVNF